MVMRWLITGGCGFIGRNLIKNLVDEGDHYIRIIDNLSVGTKEDLSQICTYKEVFAQKDLFGTAAGDVDLIVGDILDIELAMETCKDIDVIVHLAANTGVGPSVENPRKDCEANVFGTLNYLEGARKNNSKRFVFASSGAPAGECEPPIHEELPPHPVSPYGASKLAGEGYCSAYFRTFNLETVCLRFGNVYGPLSGKKDSVVAKFIKRAVDGLPLEIYGDGQQTRDFIYIDDLIRSIRLSVSSENAAGETFQIATNNETTVFEMAKILVSVLENNGISNVDIQYGEKRQGDVMRNFSDTTKAHNLLEWKCSESLETGLKKTVQWFLDIE